MSGNSNVGNAGVYEAGDQRNYKDSELNQTDRFHEGKENSHKAQDSSTSPHILTVPAFHKYLHYAMTLHNPSTPLSHVYI
jgi:hypothetical protein